MTEQGNTAEWGAENLQVSIFTNTPHKINAGNLFRAAFDEDATNTNENVHPNLGRQGNATAPGPGNMARLIQILPGRCDVMIIPGDMNWTNAQFPAVTADVAGSLKYLVNAASKIAHNFEIVSRLAVNCRLAKHFETLEEANAEISGVLPLSFPLGKATRDFIVQHNLRSEAAGYRINRLVKWSVEPIQLFSGPPNDTVQSTLIREFWAAVVHLDFNTVVPSPILNAEAVPKTLDAIAKAVETARSNKLFHD